MSAVRGRFLAALTAMLAGCGSGGEEDRVREAATAYLEAIAVRDHAGACSLMSTAMRETVQSPEGRRTGYASCEEGLRRSLGRQAPTEARAELERLDDARVSIVDGRAATIGHASDGRVEPGSLFFLREDGEWRLHPAGPG